MEVFSLVNEESTAKQNNMPSEKELKDSFPASLADVCSV